MTEKTKYLKIEEFAKEFNIGNKVARKLTRDGVIPTVVFGYRTVRIPSDKLEAALTRITTGHNPKKERLKNDK